MIDSNIENMEKLFVRDEILVFIFWYKLRHRIIAKCIDFIIQLEIATCLKHADGESCSYSNLVQNADNGHDVRILEFIKILSGPQHVVRLVCKIIIFFALIFYSYHSDADC